MDPLMVGQHLRSRRQAAGMTLQALGARVGLSAGQLSMIENGRREPRLARLDDLAAVLGTSVAALLSTEAPNRRAALEVELERFQRGPAYAASGLPPVPISRTTPDDVLEAVVGLHRELQRRDAQAAATPEEARRANTELRLWLRDQEHYLADLEQAATELTRAVGHTVGALTHRTVSRMAQHLGFSILHVADLPHSTRSVIDLENGRIYLPPASIPGGHGLRALALQAMAHRVLGHREPWDYGEFLRQRLQINYFAAACLQPEEASVAFLRLAKDRRDLAIEDFRDAFGVTHEAAALRLLNLATVHLGLRVHFLRVRDDGTVLKAYENDGLPLSTDVLGSVEGQQLHRAWAARAAFERTNRTTESYQFTDTPAGTFWCSTQTGTTSLEEFSITVGVRFQDSKWFRGRDTPVRADASSPTSARAGEDEQLQRRWHGRAWPSAKLHAHILSPLPSGRFPGVDDVEVFRFLDRHAPN